MNQVEIKDWCAPNKQSTGLHTNIRFLNGNFEMRQWLQFSIVSEIFNFYRKSPPSKCVSVVNKSQSSHLIVLLHMAVFILVVFAFNEIQCNLFVWSWTQNNKLSPKLKCGQSKRQYDVKPSAFRLVTLIYKRKINHQVCRLRRMCLSGYWDCVFYYVFSWHFVGLTEFTASTNMRLPQLFRIRLAERYIRKADDTPKIEMCKEKYETTTAFWLDVN